MEKGSPFDKKIEDLLFVALDTMSSYISKHSEHSGAEVEWDIFHKDLLVRGKEFKDKKRRIVFCKNNILARD